MTNEHKDTAVRVCPLKDRECGDIKQAWCDTCPKRASFNEHKDLPALPEPFMELLSKTVYDAWADQMRAYAREHGDQQRLEGRRDAHETNIVLLSENMRLKDALAAPIAQPASGEEAASVASKESVQEGWRAKLKKIADWLKSNAQDQQVGPDEWTPDSQFDYELGKAGAEIEEIISICTKECRGDCVLCRNWYERSMEAAQAAPQGQQSAGAGLAVHHVGTPVPIEMGVALSMVKSGLDAAKAASGMASAGPNFGDHPLDRMLNAAPLPIFPESVAAKAAPAQEAGRVRVGSFKWNGVSRPQVWFDDVPLFGEESMQSPEADHVEAFGKYIVANLKFDPAQEADKKMTAHRAAYFMERFKREEKLLGPNEQAAVDFVIAMLEAEEAAPAKPAQDLVAAIRSLHEPATLIGKCDTYREGFYKARDAAANLVAASLKGEKYQGSKS